MFRLPRSLRIFPVIVRGDVAACKTAVETGIAAVEEMGAEVYSSVVIPSPHIDLGK
jgi:ethanolamine utilization protein EutM